MKPQNIVKQANLGTKQVVTTIAQIAAQNAKAAGETVQRQIGIKEDEFGFEEEPEIVREIRNEGPKLDVEEIHAKDRAMLAELEQKLKTLREKREQEKHAYTESIANQMEVHNEAAVDAPVQAQGKVRRALGETGKKVKKAISTILTGKRGETKAGSGKG